MVGSKPPTSTVVLMLQNVTLLRFKLLQFVADLVLDCSEVKQFQVHFEILIYCTI